MDSQQIFDQLTAEFGLKPADYYLLDLIPLIEMIWVDGQNQEGELKILYRFVIDHIAYLDQATGLRTVTVREANDFLDRFAHSKPSSKLLKELRKLAISSANHSDRRKMTILEYCLDIAAACVTCYPYKLRDRFMILEKQFLMQLLIEFDISAQQSADFLARYE